MMWKWYKTIKQDNFFHIAHHTSLLQKEQPARFS